MKKSVKLTKLEQFVMFNESRGFDTLATELNTTVKAIESAFNRGNAKRIEQKQQQFLNAA